MAEFRYTDVLVERAGVPPFLRQGTGHGNAEGTTVTVFSCKCTKQPPLESDFTITATDASGRRVVLFDWRCSYNGGASWVSSTPCDFRKT